MDRYHAPITELFVLFTSTSVPLVFGAQLFPPYRTNLGVYYRYDHRKETSLQTLPDSLLHCPFLAIVSSTPRYRPIKRVITSRFTLIFVSNSASPLRPIDLGVGVSAKGVYQYDQPYFEVSRNPTHPTPGADGSGPPAAPMGKGLLLFLGQTVCQLRYLPIESGGGKRLAARRKRKKKNKRAAPLGV